MSMFNDIDRTKKGNDGLCISNLQKVKDQAKRFLQGHWTFLGLGDEKKWHGTLPDTPEGTWNSTANLMVEKFKDTGHPVFKSISALSRGILKKKKKADTTHFNADASNTELLFRIIHSVNQLSIYGAVSNRCEQFGLTQEEKRQEKQKESVTRGVLTSVKSQEVKLVVLPPKTSIWKQFAKNIQVPPLPPFSPSSPRKSSFEIAPPSKSSSIVDQFVDPTNQLKPTKS